ncbi:MAG TPA: nucleotidyltransferase domain-containing protein [Thermodesulfovibrionales bacterium]|nr:nucleotidyltransferase domain-containing protein [Thermodesulfovibrionales bacterium]
MKTKTQNQSHAFKRPIDDFKRELSALYKDRLKQIILYGSWARVEATGKSDINVALVLQGRVKPGQEIDRIIDIASDLNSKHGVLLSVYPVSEHDYRHIKSPLLMNIRKEGVPV